MASEPDLHSLLLGAITARKAQAEAAAEGAGDARWRVGPPKRCECCNSVLSAVGMEVIATDDRLTGHIAAEDPAAVLRQVAEDFDVLTRHYVCSDLNCAGGDCHTCRDEFYPCPEVRSLARRYGLMCTTCDGSRQVKCMAHVAGDGCDELILACPDCVPPAGRWRL